MSEIQEEAYSEACEEIDRLKIEIGALRREHGRRAAEIEVLRASVKGLVEVLEEGLDDSYPAGAPLRKLLAEGRLAARI